MKMKTAKELILETVKLYSKSPQKRGVNENGSCYYLSEEGNKCAVGRIMSAKGLKEYGHFRGDAGQLLRVVSLCNIPRTSMFKPSYHDVVKDAVLLSLLQTLHDDMIIWGAKNSIVNKPMIQQTLRRLADHEYLSEAEAEELTEAVINNLQKALN